MKAYEGKNFAFIRAIYWLLMSYANYEGKLNFKQKNMEWEKPRKTINYFFLYSLNCIFAL